MKDAELQLLMMFLKLRLIILTMQLKNVK